MGTPPSSLTAEGGGDGESKLLQACPRCDYRLTTQPIEHRCPECGLRVDRRWEVFGRGKMSRYTAQTGKAIWGILAIPALYLLVIATIPVVMGRAPWYWLPLGILPLAASVLFLRQPQRFIAIADDAFLLYLGRDRWERQPFAEVDSVFNAQKHIALRMRDGRTIFWHTFRIFGVYAFDAPVCVLRMNARLKAWRIRDDASADPTVSLAAERSERLP
jgi:hypothetical protein